MDFEATDLIPVPGYGSLVSSCEYGEAISDFMKGETSLNVRVTIRFSKTPLGIASK